MRSIALAVCTWALVVAGAAQAAAVKIPFVGCPSDGQNGPLPAPKGKSHVVKLDSRLALRLAFYKSDYDDGVIAPRGWHCVGLYGSNGAFLVVTPKARTANDLLLHHTSVSGPAIQMSVSYGGTSGRFEVAAIAARYFPKHRAYVNRVIAEGLEPASAFVFAPFPGDRFIHRDGRRVEVETPPRATGLGTSSRLAPDGLPIRSVAIVEDADPLNLIQLTVRLPPEARDLLPAIIGQLR